MGNYKVRLVTKCLKTNETYNENNFVYKLVYLMLKSKCVQTYAYGNQRQIRFLTFVAMGKVFSTW